MAEIQSRVKDYLREVWSAIDGQYAVAGVSYMVQSEKELEKHVALGLPRSNTLLRVLGYTEDDVSDHCVETTIIGHLRYAPDYLLKRHGTPVAVVELKAPKGRLTDGDAEQLSYCEKKDLLFGLLFNGVQAQLFLNTQDSRLSRRRAAVSGRPIAAAERDSGSGDSARLVAEVLSHVSAIALDGDVVALARKLIERRKKADKAAERKQARMRTVRDRLEQIRVEPPDYLLTAMTQMDPELSALKPKPTKRELREAWSPGALAGATTAQPVSKGINPLLRQKVTAVCAQRGWGIWAQGIKGLRYRLDGSKLNGYSPVPAGEGVPPGLCVQGVNSGTGEDVIRQLDLLLDAK